VSLPVVTRRVVWRSGTRWSQSSPTLPDCWRPTCGQVLAVARTLPGSGRQQIASDLGSGLSANRLGDRSCVRFDQKSGVFVREPNRARPLVSPATGARPRRAREGSRAVLRTSGGAERSREAGEDRGAVAVGGGGAGAVAVAVCGAGAVCGRGAVLSRSQCGLFVAALDRVVVLSRSRWRFAVLVRSRWRLLSRFRW
jgi:hypothetical protein